MSGDSGLATVWTAGAIVALLAVAGVVLALGSVVVARHRATDAADLAALAAAGEAAGGSAAACRQASEVTGRMAVRLVSCRFEQWDALVEVEADAPNGLGTVAAHARAGPVARRMVPGAASGS